MKRRSTPLSFTERLRKQRAERLAVEAAIPLPAPPRKKSPDVAVLEADAAVARRVKVLEQANRNLAAVNAGPDVKKITAARDAVAAASDALNNAREAASKARARVAEAKRVERSTYRLLRDADRSVEKIKTLAPAYEKRLADEQKSERKLVKKRLKLLDQKLNGDLKPPAGVVQAVPAAEDHRPIGVIVAEAWTPAEVEKLEALRHKRLLEAPAIDNTPAEITGEYVTDRMVEAMRILARTPIKGLKPSSGGTAWPGIMRLFGEVKAALPPELMNSEPRGASIEEMRLVEEAVVWPMLFLKDRPPEVARAFNEYAKRKALGRRPYFLKKDNPGVTNRRMFSRLIVRAETEIARRLKRERADAEGTPLRGDIATKLAEARDHGGRIVRAQAGLWTYPNCASSTRGGRRVPNWSIAGATVDMLITRGHLKVERRDRSGQPVEATIKPSAIAMIDKVRQLFRFR